VYSYQVAASLTEPKVFDIVHGQLASIRREFAKADAFSGWMLGYDEIRVHGWDEAPKAGGGTPGEDLAANVRAVYADARRIDPGARLFTWSDMFDPLHNAADSKDPYYLVNGNWSGSWAGVPADVTILNWNSQPDKRRASAAFFAGRGHSQILAGYYDAPVGAFRDRPWLADLAGLPGIEGVMYTQWGSGYGNLEAWAKYIWGDAPWVTPTPGSGPTVTSRPNQDTTTPPPPATDTPGVGPTPTALPASPTPTGGPVRAHVFLPWAWRSAR
jgi:hypothetical protein